MSIRESAIARIEESEVFSRHFGSFTKSDFETLMFTIYLDSLDSQIRDYDISIALGITETKVRNLRIKSQLIYPKKLEWERELENSIKHGIYNSNSREITLYFEDPSIQNHIKNLIEEKCGVVNIAKNSKHLIVPVQSILILAAYTEQDSEKVLSELNEKFENENKSIKHIEGISIKDRLFKQVSDINKFMKVALSVYSNGRIIITNLLEVMNNCN